MALLNKLIRALIPEQVITKLKYSYHVPDMEWSLSNLRANGFHPESIVDIGAYEGEWTKMTRALFPEASFLMIEAQASKKEKLQMLADKLPGVDYEICLLGAQAETAVPFYINETVSSALPETSKTEQEYVDLPMLTLDEVLTQKNMKSPDLIKLDVQGFELEVLKGGVEAMKKAEVVLMEVSLIDINQGAPLIDEVIAFMKHSNFRCYDICSMVRRPLDKALWQTDILFVKEGSALISSKNWA